MTIRPAVAEDAEAVAALRRAVFPYLPSSAAQIDRTIADPPPAEKSASWVAEADGVVGWGTCGLNAWTSEPGIGALTVFVHPEHRGRGIGSALLDVCHDHLSGIDARRSRSFVTRDATGYAGRRGYTPNREMHYASLDLRALPPQPPVPRDVRLLSAAEVGPELMYDADAAATLDEPSDVSADAIDYDDWLHEIWDGPMLDLDLTVAAVVDGRVAAFTAVETDGELAWSGMTGTLREYRGRGLAKLVKSVALRRAADAGIQSAATSTDDRNGPMLAVNQWLGYRRVATHVGVTRDL
jgi:GNAT superfamily N-acetyltransferase